MPKNKKVHYEVFALRDGTILAAGPGRKIPTCRVYPEPEDEDGVCRWHTELDFDSLKSWKTNPMGVLAVVLNVRKAIRAQVEPRLELLQQQMATLREQLDRIEKGLEAKALR
jgi:hypothetical protein